MDGDRFDAMSRVLATAGSRRRLLRAAGAVALGTFGAWLDRGEVAACRRPGRRCRRDRQCCGDGDCVRGRCRCRGRNVACGRACCRDCFVENNPDEPRRAFCCPARRVCRSPRGRRFDLCCYGDEVCDEASGTCCRRCGDGAGGRTCCDSDEFCDSATDRCVPFSSARLHRFRR